MNVWIELGKQLGFPAVVIFALGFAFYKMFWPAYLKQGEDSRELLKSELAANRTREEKKDADFRNALTELTRAMRDNTEAMRTEFQRLHRERDK